MIELLRTNNIVLIARIEALLSAEDIGYFIADGHTSMIEGSIGVIPRRILVLEEDHATARQHLTAIGLGHELPAMDL